MLMLPSRQPRTVLGPFLQTGIWPLHCHWMKPPKIKVARLSIPTSQKHSPTFVFHSLFGSGAIRTCVVWRRDFFFRFGRGKSYRRDRRRVGSGQFVREVRWLFDLRFWVRQIPSKQSFWVQSVTLVGKRKKVF